MARVYIESYGCTLNLADSQAMITKLKAAGFTFVEKPEESDVIIVNSCTVKSPTETKILRRLRYLKSLEIPIILAGCMPQAEPSKKGLSDFTLLGVYQINRIVEVVEEALAGNTVVLLAYEDYDRLELPHVQQNPIIDIIPICQGCLGAPCSYCIVKKARGELFSYEPKRIIKRIEESVACGTKEIWLTAQDTAAYGKDIGTDLTALLKEIIKVKGEFRVRLGMGNPNFVKGFLPDLIEIFKSPKMFKFLHLPVQAGNNEILKRMKREYTVEEFKHIVSEFRKHIPKITIATDIICGFPGETAKQFKDSLNLIQEIKPDVLNISRYWPRPGTSAAKYPGYSGNVTKKRSRKMTLLFNEVAFQNNLKWLGWQGPCIIDEKGELNWKGRNFAYKQLTVISEEALFGKQVQVRVFDITKYDLKAKILNI